MTSTIKSYRDLDVWKRSVELAVMVYKVTGRFPKTETYGLTDQMRRASVSVPSNIAEGHNRAGNEFYRFISYSLGSLAELETQSLIALKIQILNQADFDHITAECDAIGKILRVIQKRLPPRP